MKLLTQCAPLLLLLVPIGCGRHEPPPVNDEATDMVAAPSQHGAQDFVAVLAAKTSEAITAQTDSAIMALKVHNNQVVHKGDVLVVMDTSQLKLQLDKAQADKARAQASAGASGATASSICHKAALTKRLVLSGVSSEAELAEAQAQCASRGAASTAEMASVKGAESAIEEIQQQIDRAEIKSPLDGTVRDIRSHQGEVPHRGSIILRVFDPSQVEMRFALPRDNKALVKKGDHVAMTVPDQNNRQLGATVSDIEDPHDAAIPFLTVIAQIDPGVRAEDLTVGVQGKVHIADQGVAQ